MALCCDFSEYENIEAFAREQGEEWQELLDGLREEHDGDEDAIYEAFLTALEDETWVIDIDGESFIIAHF